MMAWTLVLVLTPVLAAQAPASESEAVRVVRNLAVRAQEARAALDAASGTASSSLRVDFERVCSEIEAVADSRPDSLAVQNAAGGALLAVRRHPAASRLARRALEISPGDKSALAIHAQSRGRGDPAPAAPARESVEPASVGESRSSGPQVSFSVPAPRRTTVLVPAPARHHMIDDEGAAPEPTLLDRIKARVTPDKRIVDEDIRTLRERAATFDLPVETLSLGSANFEAPRQFVSWLKGFSSDDLPPISYGSLPAGVLASYEPGLLGKGKIVINHFLRDAEPEARATALVHELYHYWDVAVAANPYPSVSYGMHSREAVARREYDPYALTALFWRHARPHGAGSPASKSLDRLPTDVEELQRRVDELVFRRKDKR